MKKQTLVHIVNIITVFLIIESFLCAMLLVRKYAREDCFDRIEEAAAQASQMLASSIKENENKLTLFASSMDLSAPKEKLEVYMSDFCTAQDFDGVCLYKRDGTAIYSGSHTVRANEIEDFDAVSSLAPFISKIMPGEDGRDKYFYQCVPLTVDGKTEALLFGSIPISVLPELVSSGAYGGECDLYVIDGESGDFLMATSNAPSNLSDFTVDKVKSGYDIRSMRDDTRSAKSGFFVFRSAFSDEWMYICYMPLGINSWSFQLSVDEPTAFASYDRMSLVMLILAAIVIVLMIVHIFAMMHQASAIKNKDVTLLKKTSYINEVQRSLLSAHNNPIFIVQALKTVSAQLEAETTLLLTFSDMLSIKNVYYWPSKDRHQAMNLVGRNLRADFPVLYDILSEGKSFIYYGDSFDTSEMTENELKLFEMLEVSNIMLVPVVDNSGSLKGAICTANMTQRQTPDMLECLVYDFFMAITNVENHEFITKMGMIDYLTGVKNRNSYESESYSLLLKAKSTLWCVFADVNGLHQINNTKGHKAGDRMLCFVANAIKRIYGGESIYRIGGDEFLVFCFDESEEEMDKKQARLKEELSANGYFVSIGKEHISADTTSVDIEKLVARAESKMYEEKRRYYEDNNIPQDRDHLPV